MTIRVLVVDDQTLVRAGFAAIIDLEPDMEVVGEVDDGSQVLEAARSTLPDVVLMDIRMQTMDGIAATRALLEHGPPGVRVLMLTTFDLDEYLYEALRSGASGFLLKDAPPERVFDAVRVVAAGEALLAPAATRRLIETFVRSRSHPRPDASRLLAALTDREREVVALVGRGLSNADISASLVVSEATTKTHVSRAMAKLQARDRAQLVVLAYESGLVHPGGA